MDIEAKILSDFDKEIDIGAANHDRKNTDYESYLGLIDGTRDEKTYEWQSDIRIPVFMSHFLTQGAMDVGQYFQTRDFVEVKINDPSPQAKLSAEASKECLNRTLNKRDLQHYQKFVRAKAINNLSGRVWLKCWWEQEFEEKQVGVEIESKELDVDINGEFITEDWQVPQIEYEEIPVFEPVPVRDCFNYDVWDQRNVFVSDDYAYSAQDKEWIILRSETTKSKLEDLAELNDYFNLDEIGKSPSVTKTKQESYQKYDTKADPGSKAERPLDLYERYGKAWFKGDNPGLDINGDIKKGAKYEEAVITVVEDNSKKILIGYRKTPYVSATGRPYRPVIRGLCYIHPAEDEGIGDGQNVRELQTAIDDTFNIAQDRTMLATLPSLKGRKNSIEDNTTIRIEPMHMMELDDVNDVQEFKISADTMGALNQLAYLENMGRQVDSINETTTGGVPSIASTTATAVASANQNTNNRMNYKSLTFEYTALTELYWMILQMTYSFASEETAMKLMGDKAYDFDPTLDYYYSPLSQSIETESSKQSKRQEWMSLIQVVAQIQHPSAPQVMNIALSNFVKLMGDEFEGQLVQFFDESQPLQSGQDTPQGQGEQASNQYGQPQTNDEMMARSYAG